MVSGRLKQRVRLFRRCYLRRATPVQPVFVLSVPRAGSNLLLSYLRSVPGVAVRGEVLNPTLPEGLRLRLVTRAAVLRHIGRSLRGVRPAGPGIVRTSVAKVHLTHLAAQGLTVDDLGRAFPDARFVVLVRASLADSYVSLLTARQTRQWLLHDARQRAAITIRIDRDEARRYFEQIRSLYADLARSEWLRARSVVVRYDELAREPQRLFDERICPFLGLPRARVATTLAKQNTRTLADVVENYRDVEDLLLGPAARHPFDDLADRAG